MKKKLAILLSLIMVVTMLPTFALTAYGEDTMITSLNITLPIPSAGDINTGTSVIEGDTYTIEYVWYQDAYFKNSYTYWHTNEAFMAGQTYQAIMKVIPKSGYYTSNDSAVIAGMDIKVNGRTPDKQWYNSSYGRLQINFIAKIPADVEYQVTVNGGTATSDARTIQSNINVAPNIPVQIKAPAESGGYTFDHWEVTGISDTDLADATSATTTFTMPSGPVTATPKYKEPEQFTVSFANNGGTGQMESVTVQENDTYTLPQCTFTPPEGKAFKAWNLGAPGTKITVTGNVTLTPVWQTRIDTVNITIPIPEAGSIDSVQTLRIAGETYDLEYSWYKDMDFNNSYSYWHTNEPFVAGQTYCASFKILPKDGYFVSNQASVINNMNITVNGETAAYQGWNTSYSTVQVKHYVKIPAANEYALTINGGTGTKDAREWGTSINVAETIPVKIVAEAAAVGMEFDHWQVTGADSSALADPTAMTTVFTMPAGPVTLEAVYVDHAHTLVPVAGTPSTCLTNGTKDYYQCSDCGKRYLDEAASQLITSDDQLVAPKAAHTYTNYVSQNNATCEQDGTMKATCDVCHLAVDTMTDYGSRLGHSFTKYVSNGNATCTVDGTKTATCDREGCSAIDTLPDVGSALGHSFTNYISNGDVTCTDDGTKTAKCDRCNVTDTVVEKALGHEPSEWIINPAKVGVVGEKHIECTVCHDILKNESIPPIKTVKLSTVKYTYNGKLKTPVVTVIDDASKVLTKDTDYTVTYATGRKAVGKYKVTVKFQGNYTGTKTLYFTINPATPAVKSMAVGTRSLKVTMTTKPSAKGAGTYQIAYRVKGTTTWKYTTTTASYKTIKSLKKGKVYQVRIRAYKTVNKVKYYGNWTSIKTTKKIK